jgi:hypothetical protein
MKIQENCSFEELKKQAIFFYDKSITLTNEISYLKEQLTWLKTKFLEKNPKK